MKIHTFQNSLSLSHCPTLKRLLGFLIQHSLTCEIEIIIWFIMQTSFLQAKPLFPGTSLHILWFNLGCITDSWMMSIRHVVTSGQSTSLLVWNTTGLYYCAVAPGKHLLLRFCSWRLKQPESWSRVVLEDHLDLCPTLCG